MLTRNAAIAGVGATRYTKNSGRSELAMAIEAIGACLADAGMSAGEVDGFSTFGMQRVSELDLQSNLRMSDLRFLARTPYGGGGGCATIGMAALAVRSGQASAVLAFRSLNSSSGVKFGGGELQPPPEVGDQTLYDAVGLRTPAARVGITATRYLHEYGLDDTAFWPVAHNARTYAYSNPRAHFYQRALTFEDYVAEPYVSRPLRRPDCCQETDGAVAILITNVERAKHARRRPVIIKAAAQSAGPGQGPLAQYWSDDILRLPEVPGLKQQLEQQAGFPVTDVDGAMFYDHFAPLILLQLEQFGFCNPGEGSDFIARGETRLDGSLPLNTHGGHLGEAYLHGMNAIFEAVQQLRGQAINQIPDPKNILVTSAAGAPSSALILGCD